MELRSVLLLLLCLSIILAITYYINLKQKKRLSGYAKQDPKFDAHLNLRQSLRETPSEESTEYSEIVEENLLLENEPVAQKPAPQKNSPIDEVIYLMLRARTDRPYVGYELLQALLSSGLRYGSMNIFHRFDEMDRNKILFSVASAQEPGTFEITKMGGYSLQGLMMFLRFSNTKDMALSFNIMIETAQQLIEDLGGELLDESKNILTHEKIEKWRKKIMLFESKQVIADLFE